MEGVRAVKALIIYDTKFGNTEKVAKTITEALSAKYEVTCKKVSETSISEIQEADLILIGSPTHAWNMSLNTKKLFNKLEKERFEGKIAAAFDTKLPKWFAGSAAKKIEKRLKELGFGIALPYFNAYVTQVQGPLRDGEIERCREFSARLLEIAK